MLSRRSFITRAAVFVAGVRLAIEGAVIDLGTPEAHAEVQPCVESTGLRIDPDTLEFEFLSENGWIGTGHALIPWVAPGFELMKAHPDDALTYRQFHAQVVNGTLTRSWKKAAMPKAEAPMT